jgi:hypothetical protein
MATLPDIVCLVIFAIVAIAARLAVVNRYRAPTAIVAAAACATDRDPLVTQYGAWMFATGQDRGFGDQAG